MTTNNTVCKIQQSILCRTFLSSKFVGTIFLAYIGTVQLTFVDALSGAPIISSHTITYLTIVLAKYLPFSQLHVE